MTALVLLGLAAVFVAFKLAAVAVKVVMLVLVVATAIVVIPIHRGIRLLL